MMTNNDLLAEKIRHLANHGVERDPSRFITRHASIFTHDPIPQWYYEMHNLGYNGRLTDIQCALGLSQLKRLGWFKEKRQSFVKKYNKALEDLAEKEVIILPPWPEDSDPCYHLYPLRLGPHCVTHRDPLYQELREKGIFCQIHYMPIYRQPFYQEQYHHESEHFPESEKYFASCISLPLFPHLDDNHFSFIVDEIIASLKS